MKKKYITPSAIFVALDSLDLISTSPQYYNEGSDTDQENL